MPSEECRRRRLWKTSKYSKIAFASFDPCVPSLSIEECVPWSLWMTVAQFPKGAVIDEAQRAPDLPSYLQGIIDDDPKPDCWILTGSQKLSLLESVSHMTRQ